MLHRCTCKSLYQDSLYGSQMRVFNPMKDKSKARCTCCGKIETIAVVKKEEKKGKEK